MDVARETALKILYNIEKNGAYSNLVLDETIKKNQKKLNNLDIGLISELVYGVTKWKITLDEIIKMYSKIKLKKISQWIINILRLGTYQIIFLDKIPKSAAVNEGVNLAKKYGNKGSVGFTNAILRKIEKNDLNKLKIIEDPIERISKITSMPIWIVEKLIDEYGVDDAEQICMYLNLKPKTVIRVNTLKTNLNEILKNKEIDVEKIDNKVKNFLILKNAKSIENMELFKEGYFTVQDLSAGLAVEKLNPKPGERVLDCCSAPGGKTTYIGELMKNNGYIEAWDIYEHRLKLVEQTSKRLGINIINTKIKDASKYYEKYNEKFDKILLDVPCMGIGVIKRKPDIKWQKEEKEIKKITRLQLGILTACSKYLKKGGKLVYSTCSIFKEENQNIIEQFLKKNQNFEFSDKKNKYIYIKPNEIQDGFFICNLTKK